MGRSRRHFLQMAATCVPALVVSIAPAQAQLQWLEPFLEAIGPVGAALTIVDVLAKWYLSSAGDKRCKVDIGDLENIKLNCQILSETLNDDTIPTLKNFVINKDGRNWKKVKISVAQLLADGELLMQNIDRVTAKLDANTYPGPREDIQRVYHGVDNIRAAMLVLGRLPDNPEPEDFKQAEKVLNAIFALPELATNAATNVQIALDDRQKLSCP